MPCICASFSAYDCFWHIPHFGDALPFPVSFPSPYYTYPGLAREPFVLFLALSTCTNISVRRVDKKTNIPWVYINCHKNIHTHKRDDEGRRRHPLSLALFHCLSWLPMHSLHFHVSGHTGLTQVSLFLEKAVPLNKSSA